MSNFSFARIFDLTTKALKVFKPSKFPAPIATLTDVVLSPDARLLVAIQKIVGKDSEENPAGAVLVTFLTESGRRIAELPLNGCIDDLRHIEVGSDSRHATLICQNGQVFDVDLIEGKMTAALNLGPGWQGASGDPYSAANITLLFSRHSVSADHSMFFASTASGVLVWRLTQMRTVTFENIVGQ